MNEIPTARSAQKPNPITKSKVGGSKLDQHNLNKENLRTRSCEPSMAAGKTVLNVVKKRLNEMRSSTMLNIYQKLCQIQSQTAKIAKTEENKFGKYKYFTERQALDNFADHSIKI